MIPSVGGPELIIFLVIILLLFGAKRIPELAKSLGTGVREFRRGTSGEDEKASMKDSEGGKELPQGEAAPDERAQTEDAGVHAEQTAGQSR